MFDFILLSTSGADLKTATPDTIFEIINNSPELQAIATILGIFGVGLFAWIPPVRRFIKNNYRYFLCRRIKVYRREGYYNEAFVFNRIQRAKKEIRIICVRNSRISSPDILRALRKFVTEKNGKVELYYLDPSNKVSDDIIDKIRKTLPTPPSSVITYRKEALHNEERIKSEIQEWDSTKRGNISLYRFSTLPSIHLCQFDKRIFLGYQFFDPCEATELSGKTLNDLCTVIRTKSELGKLLTKQIDYLRDNHSEKIN